MAKLGDGRRRAIFALMWYSYNSWSHTILSFRHFKDLWVWCGIDVRAWIFGVGAKEGQTC
jgi:hypothetical protein